jgi:hypothetical protein
LTYPSWYEKALDALEFGAVTCFVPVDDGMYKAVFVAGSDRVKSHMICDPCRFGVIACDKAREFARDNGYLTEDL